MREARKVLNINEVNFLNIIKNMDCYFNKFIPKPSEDTIIIRPATKTFVNGMAESYSYE